MDILPNKKKFIHLAAASSRIPVLGEEHIPDLDPFLLFKELFKNPGKLMKIVKKVGSKLDEKLKSGEIKESELLKEASDLMKKMGNTPVSYTHLTLPTNREV